jgi:hypothetical protein
VDDDVVVGLTGRHHGEHLLEGVGAEVDHDRTVVNGIGLLDRRCDIFGRLGPDAHATHGLGPFDVVGKIG